MTDRLRWVRRSLIALAVGCHATRLWLGAPPWTVFGVVFLVAASALVLLLVYEGHVTRFVRAVAHDAAMPVDAALGRAVLFTPPVWLFTFEAIFEATVWLRLALGAEFNSVAVYVMPLAALNFGLPLALLVAASLAALAKRGVTRPTARSVAFVPSVAFFGAFLLVLGWGPLSDGRFSGDDVAALAKVVAVYGVLLITAPILVAACAVWAVATHRGRARTA